MKKLVQTRKWRKVEGGKGAVVEMVEAAGEFGIVKITDLANSMYSTGQVPDNMKFSEFLTIPKKKGALEHSTHRTINVILQMAKVVLKVLDVSSKRKVEETVDKVQFGFLKGLGTRKATFILRTIME